MTSVRNSRSEQYFTACVQLLSLRLASLVMALAQVMAGRVDVAWCAFRRAWSCSSCQERHWSLDIRYRPLSSLQVARRSAVRVVGGGFAARLMSEVTPMTTSNPAPMMMAMTLCFSFLVVVGGGEAIWRMIVHPPPTAIDYSLSPSQDGQCTPRFFIVLCFLPCPGCWWPGRRGVACGFLR